jgi:hypothetical protein
MKLWALSSRLQPSNAGKDLLVSSTSSCSNGKPAFQEGGDTALGLSLSSSRLLLNFRRWWQAGRQADKHTDTQADT